MIHGRVDGDDQSNPGDDAVCQWEDAKRGKGGAESTGNAPLSLTGPYAVGIVAVVYEFVNNLGNKSWSGGGMEVGWWF
ncbi:unnamed protein product [Prunus armeniaca]|uniref:Uncharacterized protein n=1 Tax=Prunus armeniaca TaxID=36596 RepID=A0A6J5Y768_PRUAR|nr:unnamed protein product [Prunus armeniaca]